MMPKRGSTSSLPSPKKKKSMDDPPAPVSSDESPRKRNTGKNNQDSDTKNSEPVEALVKLSETPRKVLTLERKESAAQDLKKVFFAFFGEVTEVALNTSYVDVMKKARELSNTLEEEEPTERKGLVDQFMRDFLLDQVLEHGSRSWHNFLELSIQLAREQVCNASILFTLISDLVELSTLKDCQRIFDFVERHLEIWKEPLFLNSGKNAVLRMCNDLLRRLSRAQNTIFCGRILIFLSNYFPFSERSGLNIMSEFNNDNVTVYKSDDGTDDPDDKMDVTEEKPEVLFEGMDVNIPGLDKIIVLTQEEKKNKMKVDYNLYVKFWSLQEFFRNPLQCYNKIVWKTFTLYTNDVLTVFNFFKMDGSSSLKKKRKNKKKRADDAKVAFIKNSSMNDIPRLTDESLYFAKYLTNRRLLELQMNDSSFRRYFMVQLLIILQYLTVNVKFKSDGQILTEEQQDFVKKTTERVFGLLEDTPPAGKEFVKAVKHVLAREQLWNQWKNDGCPAFKKPTVNAALVETSRLSEKDEKMDVDDEKGGKSSSGKTSKSKKHDQDDDILRQIEEAVTKPPKKKKRRRLGDIIADAAENNRFLMGNSELTRLWNICGDNLEACRSKARDFTPPIDTFFAEAFKEVDQDSTADSKKEAQPKKILGNLNFGWRALRLLARKSPYFFQMFGGSPVHPLQNYLEFVLKKILAEKETPMQHSTPERLEKSQDSKEDNSEDGPEAKKREDDQDAEMEGEAEEDEEMMNEVRQESEEDEEEGEVNDKVRKLSDVEMEALGKALGSSWKKLGLRLGFTSDLIQFFEDETAKEPETAGKYMLQRWTEQEGDEATVADLLYTLEGLGLKEIGDNIF